MEANNMKAMREALEGMLYLACGICVNKNGCEDGRIERCEIVKKAIAALSAPPRNCDIYDAKTAEKEFVRQTGSKSIRMKSVRWLYAHSGMPYESEAKS